MIESCGGSGPIGSSYAGGCAWRNTSSWTGPPSTSIVVARDRTPETWGHFWKIIIYVLYFNSFTIMPWGYQYQVIQPKVNWGYWFWLAQFCFIKLPISDGSWGDEMEPRWKREDIKHWFTILTLFIYFQFDWNKCVLRTAHSVLYQFLWSVIKSLHEIIQKMNVSV